MLLIGDAEAIFKTFDINNNEALEFHLASYP